MTTRSTKLTIVSQALLGFDRLFLLGYLAEGLSLSRSYLVRLTSIVRVELA